MSQRVGGFELKKFMCVFVSSTDASQSEDSHVLGREEQMGFRGRRGGRGGARCLHSRGSHPLVSPPPSDADPLVAGAPGAPMDMQCHDANRDYVIVTWKPPNTTTESPVIGYFVDR